MKEGTWGVGDQPRNGSRPTLLLLFVSSSIVLTPLRAMRIAEPCHVGAGAEPDASAGMSGLSSQQ